MWIFLKLFSVIFLTFVATQSLSAQSADRSQTKTITVCRIELTDVGKRARFHFNYTYSVEVKHDGSIGQVTNVRKQEYPPFIQEDKTIACVKTWKLKPAGKYVVNVSFGTAGDENAITIAAPNRESVLRLILPKD